MSAKQRRKSIPAQPAAAKPKTVSANPRPKREGPARTNTFAPGFWHQHWLPSLLLITLSFGLYWLSMSFRYVLDDQMVIWQNQYVLKGFGGLRDIFAFDSFMGYFKEQKFLLEGGRYRPLSLATFAIEHELFGPEKPGISHAINILLYGFTGVLLYRILLGLFPIAEGGRWYFSAAFLGALIFVAHPLHSECVANIKGRDELLALLGSLGALYATLKYFDTLKQGWLWGAGLMLLLGLLAKENAVTFLIVIPLTVWFFAKVPAGRSAAGAIPLLAAFLIFFILRYQAMGYVLNHGKSVTDLMNNPFLDMNFGEKYATIFLTLGWYVKLLFAPYPLTHDYYPYQVPKVNWADWRALLSLAFYLGMGVWSILNLKKRKIAAYAFVFWVATLSIVSNLFISIGTFMNERFIYMPSVAFCLLAGWFLARQLPAWLKEGADRPYILGGALALIITGAFGWITVKRVPDWKDALSLNTSALRNSPNSARSHTFYAIALYENVFLKSKDQAEKVRLLDTMEYHLNEAIKIYPNYGSAWVMIPAMAGARFDMDRQMDKLFNTFDATLDKIPNNANFRSYLDQYMKYLATRGGNPNKIAAFCYRNGYERFYLKMKDYPSAIQILEYALLLQTEDERVLKALTEVYQAAGNQAKAAEMKARADAASRTGYSNSPDYQ
jgi:hypothetical protein